MGQYTTGWPENTATMGSIKLQSDGSEANRDDKFDADWQGVVFPRAARYTSPHMGRCLVTIAALFAALPAFGQDQNSPAGTPGVVNERVVHDAIQRALEGVLKIPGPPTGARRFMALAPAGGQFPRVPATGYAGNPRHLSLPAFCSVPLDEVHAIQDTDPDILLKHGAGSGDTRAILSPPAPPCPTGSTR